MLLGLLRADGGTARLLSRDPWRDAVDLHRRIAYVPGDVTLWPNLTGAQAIEFLCGLRGGADHRRRDGLIERFELDPHRKARTYSKGNRQKVALVAAFASDADIYILDEPTSGLDPLMEKAFQQCVTEVSRRGAAVLLSSHILAEVEKLCDTVTIIRAGRTVQAGSLQQLRHLMRTTVTARTRAATRRMGLAGRARRRHGQRRAAIVGGPRPPRRHHGPAHPVGHRGPDGDTSLAGRPLPARVPGAYPDEEP